ALEHTGDLGHDRGFCPRGRHIHLIRSPIHGLRRMGICRSVPIDGTRPADPATRPRTSPVDNWGQPAAMTAASGSSAFPLGNSSTRADGRTWGRTPVYPSVANTAAEGTGERTPRSETTPRSPPPSAGPDTESTRDPRPGCTAPQSTPARAGCDSP